MPWDPPALSDDPDEVTNRILDGMAEKLPGWEPYEGAPEVALAEEIGREMAELHQATAGVLELAIAGIGETAFGFPSYQGAHAEVSVVITVTGAGAIIPAGFTVVGTNDNGDEIAFELTAEVTAGDVFVETTLTALESGLAGNSVPAGPLTIVTATTAVVDVTGVSTSTNGADPEPIEEYLDRLVDYLGTLRPGGVRAEDLAALARSVPGVDRAFAVDLYDPADPGTPSERTATVFAIDEYGAAVAGDVAEHLQAVLEEAREVNFIVHIAPPTYTAVDVEYTARCETGQDPAVVETEITAAIVEHLTSFGSTEVDVQAWEPVATIRYLELARIAGSVAGVAYIETLTLNGVAGDLVLPGVAPLPAPFDALDPSTVTGTVL